MPERVKSFGAAGVELIYFVCEKGMNLGDGRGGTLWIDCLCAAPNTYTEALTLNMMVFGDLEIGAFGR